MLFAIFILSLSSLTLEIGIEEAKRFDKMSEIRTAEDYQRYIESIRKIYLKQGVIRFGMPGSLSPDHRAGSPFQTLLTGDKELARPAACIPEQTIVPVEVPDVQPREIVIPSCTRVQRCGGCCSHSLLSCQPTSTDIVSTHALVIDRVSGANRVVETNLTQHLSCGCQCAVQEHHCHNLQKYYPEECRCACSNWEDRLLCEKSSLRMWDESTCSCQCRNQDRDCHVDMQFSETSCRCEDINMKSPISGRPNSRGRKIKT